MMEKVKSKKLSSSTFLLMATILLFVVMYVAGMIIFMTKGLQSPDVFEPVCFQCRVSGNWVRQDNCYDYRHSCAGFVEQAKGLEMDAISSAVIGGTLLSGGVGMATGTLFGVLIKGTFSSLITTQGTLSSWWVRITLSALLCFFIVLQAVIAAVKKKNR